LTRLGLIAPSGRTFAVLAAVVVSACGRGDAAEKPAGVRWVVDPHPVVEIGRGEGEDALFRVTAATRLPDGRIAVANAGTQQVKLFGADGRHLASLGRRGAGPGEVQFPLWVGTDADSILVWDAALERLTVFDPGGAIARSTQFPAVGGTFPSAIGIFPDGSLLLASGADPAAAAKQEGTAWRGDTHLVRIAPGGQILDTLATVPSQERYSYRSRDGMGQTVEDLPFGRRTVMAVRDDAVVLGTGEAYTIREVDTAGNQRELVRREWAPRPVSSADVRDYWAKMVTVGGRSRPDEAVAQRSKIPYPAALPPYDGLVVDASGALWIKDAQPPKGWDDPDLWRVYSPNGAPLATVELPARVRPQAVGDDWILGTALDDADRETVHLYRYSRG
jgi:hypothetical protein